MSLMRLLAAGKTLIGGNGAGSRYRVTQQRLLPKFGSANAQKPAGRQDKRTKRLQDDGTSGLQDDRPTGLQDHGTTGQCESGPARRESAALQAGTKQIESDGDRRSPDAWRSQGASRDAEASAGWKARPTKAAGQGSSVFGKVKALVSRRKAKPADVFGKRAARPAVQGELVLERVKVVRNDLSQDDLEVVPARGHRVGAPAERESVAQMICGEDEEPGKAKLTRRQATRLSAAGKC